jgi:uncharacterized membrane protein
MTLFGTTLDIMAVFSLISMLTLLVYWMFVLRNEKRWLAWFRGWEAERKARRLAEEDATATPEASRTSSKKGPWG